MHEEKRLTPGLVLVMAVACAVAVANLYYAQPLLHRIAQDYRTSEAVTGWAVTAAQIGYASGLLFLVPVGDMVDRRKLILAVLSLAPFALVGAALSPTFPLFLVSLLAVGITSVVAQVLLPFAASLANDEERGRVVGTIISGVLVGILGARTVSGAVSQALGWQAVYFLAAGMMAILLVVLWRTLPTDVAKPRLDYWAVLRSVARLMAEEPVVQTRSALGALAFGCFSAFWTTMAFVLSSPPFYYSAGVIGLFGLVGAAGAMAASYAGRLADRGGVSAGTGVLTAMLLASFGVLWVGGHSLTAMLVGIFLLDVAVQGLHVLNQSEVYRVAPQARSRVNSAYMTSYFVGGAIGSAASTAIYGAGGWTAVCVGGGVFGLVAFGIWAAGTRRGREVAE